MNTSIFKLGLLAGPAYLALADAIELGHPGGDRFKPGTDVPPRECWLISQNYMYSVKRVLAAVYKRQ